MTLIARLNTPWSSSGAPHGRLKKIISEQVEEGDGTRPWAGKHMCQMFYNRVKIMQFLCAFPQLRVASKGARRWQ